MKKIYNFILILSFALSVASCSKEKIEPSGNITTEQKQIVNFTGLDVSSAFTVYVSFSDTIESVLIETDDNLHRFIEVEKAGSKLVIGMKDNISISGDAVLKAYVTTSSINSYEVSGACSVYVYDSIVSDNISFDISGASSLDAVLKSNNLYADLSGASRLILIGETENLDAELSGASAFRDYSLGINNTLNLDLSGASSARLTANGDMYVDASGASYLHYRGGGTIQRLSITGASEVTKK